MNQYQIAIVALLALQGVTLWLLWRTQQAGEWFRKAWLRESRELLKIKQEQTK
jgi:hypothetical protein